MQLQVGDRVSTKMNTATGSFRVGTVAELYHGAPTGLDKGVELVAVRWDGVERIERGYILMSGSLTKIPTDPKPIGEA